MTIIKNLTVYGGQPIDSVINGDINIVEAVNDGLIEKFKKKGAR